MSKVKGKLVWALWILSFGAPAVWADIFVSGANTTESDVVSFSQATGVAKLDMSLTTSLPNGTNGMAFGPDGNLYVVNTGHQTVLRFNPASGALIGTFVPSGSGLSFPEGMTFGPDNNLYVADWDTGVRQFNGTTGAPMAAITTSGTGASLFAYDVKFGPDGNIYVSDLNSNTILRYNGSTLAYMGVFAVPPAVSSISVTQPQGLAFGPNGNLYAICIVNDLPYGIYNSMYEFDGSTGTPITAFGANVLGGDLAFGRDGLIYVPEGNAINRYNPEYGNLVSVFTTDSRIAGGFIVFGGPAPSDEVIFAPYGVLRIHTIRLTVVEGPVTVPPGVAVEAHLGFAGPEDHSVGPTSTVTLLPGQTATLDLDVSTILSSGRLEVRPVVTTPAGAPAGGTIEASVEVFDTATGIGSVFGRGVHSIAAAPVFVPQGVPYGQNIRIIALAPPDSPCTALLGFADPAGNPVGPTKNVNLQAGNMTWLDFNANSVSGQSGQRVEIQPIVTLQNATGNGGPASACEASVEVYDQHSGITSTRQDSGGSF
jgi:sugar lactone lactonase YvrE